jgi:serine phosphatase RsbU (regulator of sigma subunit)/putative methionine-R-sulfoxide reductase with GAF domain
MGERAVGHTQGGAAAATTPAASPNGGALPLSNPALSRGTTPTSQGLAASPRPRVQFLEGLVAASQAIAETLDPIRVAEVLAEEAAKILGIPGVAVMLVDEKDWVSVAASRGLSLAFLKAQAGARAETITGRALAEQRTFAAWDMRQTAEGELAVLTLQEGVVSVACAPMFFGGAALGALNVYCSEPRRFSDDEFYALSLLATQGAVALTNARAYHDLQAQTAEVRAGFQRVGEALSASLDLAETLQLIVQLSVEMTQAEGGAVYMLQESYEGGGLRLAAMRGIDRRSIRRFRLTPVSPAARRALDERRCVMVPDTRKISDMAFPNLRLRGGIAEIRSMVSVPLVAANRAVGVLEQYSARPEGFAPQEIELLASFATQATVAIENARLYAQESSIAQTLQKAFLPDLPPAIHGFEIGRVYAPGNEASAVGGDTYDLFTLPDGRIAAVIADVSGQGTYAATLAVMAKYTLRAYALEDPEPSTVVARTNDALVVQTGESTFVTLCYAVIDPATRHVALASAAHPPVICCRAATRRSELLGTRTGLIAGFLPGQIFPTEETTLAPGDALVFYTDGVIEARRRKVMFSEERLAKVVADHVQQSAQEIAAAVYSAVTDFVDDERLDDIALLVLKTS